MNRFIFFFQSASAGGVILMLASIVGIILANSGLAQTYMDVLAYEAGPLSVLLWINDALMAIFFLYVGLEVKREMMHGQLNTNPKRFLPGIAAFFGLAVPGIIYYFFAQGNAEYIRGWGVPTATDIAFAIGVITLLGDRVPTSLKVFLTALAIMDDLMAIVIIAVFYTETIHFFYLFAALVHIIALLYINKQGYIRPITYLLLGIGLWVCILKSGLHATLAGVILALTIPYHGVRAGRHVSPLVEWEHALNPWVTFLIIPIFGFANAGVSFHGVSLEDFTNPVVLGIACGLFFGKQIGIFTSVFALVKCKLVSMPENATWLQVYGTATVCGIGFTMSLFVALLAFTDVHVQEMAKIGIFLGSILSGVVGYVILRLAKPAQALEGK